MEYQSTSILLPAMDETYSLEQTVDIIYQTCKLKDIEEIVIILCDRTSSECRMSAEKMVAKYGHLMHIYIYEQKRFFVGNAIQEGFELVAGSHVVLMSTDLETDPYVVCKFIELVKKNPENIITTSRWRGEGFHNYSRIKLVCNFIFERLIAVFYGVKLSDLTYGFRIFPTELVKKIKWEEQKHPFFLETALKPIRLGVMFIEIPTQWHARTEGQSQNSFFANFNYFKTAWHIRFMRKEDIIRSETDN